MKNGVATSGSERVLQAFGLSGKAKRSISFAFSLKAVPSSWKAFTFDLPWEFYYVLAPDANLSQIRSLASGISRENFGLLAVTDSQVFLVLRRSKKDDNAPLPFSLRKEDDLERVISAIRKFNFTSDVLTAHSSLSSVVDLLKVGAERHFTNRGLFSSYFLKERLSDCLSKRGRAPSKEIDSLLGKLGGEVPASADAAVRVLEALSYGVEIASPQPPSGYVEYKLRSRGRLLDACCIVASVQSLDVKSGNKAAPSYQAVASLRRYTWVVLTNGRLWRLYSSRVSSASTNYFEVDLDGVVAENDPRLTYFISLFSALAFSVHDGVADVDLVYDEGIKYAQDVEADLRRKVFDDKLFLNLVKSVLNHSDKETYSQEKLDEAKASALKLLYRLLFVLYAESRRLLPVENDKYKQFALEYLRPRLGSFEKEPERTSVWYILRTLFEMISKGDSEANLPQYDGDLFAEDKALDALEVKNRFIVPALLDLMESEGKGIDYQNLGVRHLGSLYEALLEYSVRQAKQPMVIYRDEILDAKYTEGLKQKPLGFIEKYDLYLSAKGLARKGTGSYYTPDEIVTFLVKKGLEPHFKARAELFKADLAKLPPESKSRDLDLENKCTEDLLGLKVVDPAMGSGHFLVAVVNEITQWVIDLLREFPSAPLMRAIEEFRTEIIEAQRRKKIRLDEDLLTDTVILKRLVMKRCVYGVDINPLAVELAKVSLWLDSFTIGTPLTFLDHHIRVGDSLIGLWTENFANRVLDKTLERWLGDISKAGNELADNVILPIDLTIEEVNRSQGAYGEFRERTRAKRILLDVYCVNVIDSDLGKKLPKVLDSIETALKNGKKSNIWSWIEKTRELSEKHKFFHWELEFPDAFVENKKGFDLIVMNPPWDAVKSEDDDFFSVYEPRFRRLGSVKKKSEVKSKLLKRAEIAEMYKEYNDLVEKKVTFFKLSGQYTKRGSGDIDFWKLFLERAFALVSAEGSLSVVVPSALVTNQGAKELREVLFKNRIRAMIEFENAKGIFQDIHRSYKFVLLVVDKTKPTDTFTAAFYLHDTSALEGKKEQEKFLEMPREIGYLCSPDSLSIPEVRNKQELDVLLKIYTTHPLLVEEKGGWNIGLVREMGASPGDSRLFRTDGKGWTLMEGKCFHQFLPDFDKTSTTVDPILGLRHTAKHHIFQGINEQIHKKVRLVYRHVGSSTNVRSLIACIIPPYSFCYQSAVTVVPKRKGSPSQNSEYYRKIAYLAGMMNSLVFDFLIRKRININLTFFMVYQTPMPKNQSLYSERIIKRAARLSSIDSRFKEFASAIGVEWDHLTIKERIEMTAELNALVAKHYGLSKQHLEVILQSFEGFEEDKELERMKDVNWDDVLIRKFNGEVRKRVLTFFDLLSSEQSGVKNV